MGVKAPLGIQRFYYIAYPTGLIVGFVVYYLTCLASAPPDMQKSRGWMEPKDFVEDEDLATDPEFTIHAVDMTPGIVEKGDISVTESPPSKQGSFS